MNASAEALKSCCAAVYSSEAARLLLGDSFHPGGAPLTAHLARALRVGPGATVVDVATGRGTSALQLARETGCDVVGVDLSAANLAAATRAAESAGLAARARFVRGDAEALPLPDACADGVLCECALCTFPDKAAAAREFARVLRPGARLALADVTALRSQLPSELSSLSAWVACLGDARSLAEIADLLTAAGLEVEVAERHDEALAELLERVEVRLRAARAVLGQWTEAGLRLVASARDALGRGALGYAVVIARRP